MRHGLIQIGIGQFVITLSFEMTNYFVGGADTVKIPCKTQLVCTVYVFLFSFLTDIPQGIPN